MTTAIYGRTCYGSLRKLVRDGSWAKMFAACLIGTTDWFSPRSKLIWKISGTPSSRFYCQLSPVGPYTAEIGSGLLLTPTAVMTAEDPDRMRERAERNGYANGTKFGSLLSQLIYRPLLPTPTAYDHTSGRSEEQWLKAKEKHGDALQDTLTQRARFNLLPTPCASEFGTAEPREIHWAGRCARIKTKQGTDGMATLTDLAQNQLLPTPVARDYKGPEGRGKDLPSLIRDRLLPTPTTDAVSMRSKKYQQGGTPLSMAAAEMAGPSMETEDQSPSSPPTGINSQLSPRFVGEMMGFPAGWTESPFLNGEPNP